MRLYDVEKQEQLSDLTLPVDKLDNVSYKIFEDGTLNILINKNKWFELDRTTYALREVTLYKNVSALRDGFATIEFIGKDDSDGFKIMTNLGKERYYLPIINKVYTQRQYFNATAEALPNPVIRTAFNFSHPTHDYPEEPIQLIKYTQYCRSDIHTTTIGRLAGVAISVRKRVFPLETQARKRLLSARSAINRLA